MKRPVPDAPFKSRLRARPAGIPSDAMSDPFAPTDTFAPRHLGDDAAGTREMLRLIGCASEDALVDAAVPACIRRQPMRLPDAAGESAALAELGRIAAENQVYRSFIGLGYSDTFTPPVHPAGDLREPGLVHGLHALPVRDLPGPPGGAAQFSDDGLRPDGPGDRQRLDARRRHRGGGGDGDVPPPQGRRRPTGAGSSSSPRPATPRRSTS